MRRKDLGSVNCSVAQTLDVVGDPWTLLIVRDALFGVATFEDFQRLLEIPRATLSRRLSTLVDHGVMTKEPYESAPPRYRYVLTDKGQALHGVVVAMLQWGDEWSGLPEPPVTLVDDNTGEAIDPLLVDRATGRPLSELHIRRRYNR